MSVKFKANLFLIIIALTTFLYACSGGTDGVDTHPAKSSEQVSIQETEDFSFQSEPDNQQTDDEAPQPEELQVEVPQVEEISPVQSNSIDEILQIYVFDVRQGDCTLIKSGEHSMLIDAGDVGLDGTILDYLTEHDVKKLDYLVATHPHADHIGSMAAVVKAMDSIDELIMPDATHTTATFESLLDAIEERNLEITIPQPGELFSMGSAKIQVLAPNSNDYDDLNNNSIVLRIEFGRNTFLFTGDAENISEEEQLKSNLPLSADVLKVGHHGSTTSTTLEYLERVSPSYAVISCGKDNLYGHPYNEILQRFSDFEATVYRTDTNGTIAFTSDGEIITVSLEREETSEISVSESTIEDIKDNPTASEYPYIGNKNSKIFHLPTCSTLPAEKNRVYFSEKEEALDSNFKPCKKCKL